jgi:Transposase DDE domain
MPYKFSEGRRHKFPKARYRVTNWPDYDAALVRRGELTVWLTEEAIASWYAPATGERGGQPIYSAIAIETALTLRLVFHQPLRQTEGLLRSIAALLDIDIAIPDHTTLSRRGGGLTVLPKSIGRDEPLHLLIDSTGLKIYGEGEWLDQKRGIRSPRRWRKLHLGVDADTHEVVAVELTQDDAGDVSELVGLLDQVATQVASVIADGAYDGETVYDAVTNRHPEADIIIPPRATVGRRRAISILRPSTNMVASAGSVVLATTGEASLRPRCIGTEPSLAGVYTLGFCPVSRSKQRLDATC